MDNQWEFGKPEEIISHDFPQKLGYKDLKEILLNLGEVEFTHKEKRNGEYRYTIYLRDFKLGGKAIVITFRHKHIRVITAFPLGRRTFRKYNRKKFKNKGFLKIL